MRRAIRKIHLLLGLTSGLVVFIVSITGCIYCFEEEIRTYLYNDLLFVNHVPASAPKVNVDSIVNLVRKKYSKEIIKNIRIKNDINSSIEVTLKNKESIYIDPYSFAVLGTINKEKDFFSIVLKLHRSLYLGETGKIITGTSALIFVFLIITGLVLWWPKSDKRIKQKFTILKNARMGRKIYDLHSVLGFYASWVIIFTAFTGLVWSFKWVENSLYWATNSQKTDTRNLHSENAKVSTALSLNQLLSTSDKLCESTGEYFISLPEDFAGVVRIIVRYNSEGLLTKYDQLFFDRYSGSLIKFRPYKDLSVADRIKAMNYNIHTGKIFGITGQLLVFFASLITASLPVTGFILWRIRSNRFS